jgi:hypothetical protein
MAIHKAAVILTINADSSITNKDAVKVEFIRFDYDVEKAAKAVEDSPLPNDYVEMLRKGIDFTNHKIFNNGK